jgi:outer membrane protein insertion porin family/translocation and assembly module TamA
LALGLLPALAAGAVAQTTARDTLPVVRRVEFQGNEAFPDDSLERAIATRASGCRSVFLGPLCWVGLGAFRRIERLDPRELRTDVARLRVFYFRRGYRRAEVDTTLLRDDGRVDVIFRIHEGEPVVVRKLEINVPGEPIDDVRLEREVRLREGEPFSEVALSGARDAIERELRNRGYPQAAVLLEATIPEDDTLGAFVVLRVEPGPRATFGRIDVQGTANVEPNDVRRLLTFRSGDVYSEEEILRSQRTLYSMALFDYVSITTRPADSDSVIDVLVQVSEAAPRAIRFGAGVSTTECVQIEAGWAHRNFFGGTRRLELTGVLSNIGVATLARQFPCSQAGVPLVEEDVATSPYNKVNWRLRADFRQPWFLGTENWLHLGMFTERQSLPGIYARVSYGADVSLSREVAPGTAVIATYRPARDSLEEGSADFLWCANFGICAPEDIQTLSEPRWLSWFAVTFAQSRTDAILNPTRGYRLTLEAETASRFTGSDWAYYRAAGEVSWFRSLGSGTVLALRLRGGLVRPIGSGIEGIEMADTVEAVTHPLKRQYAGGAYTVRGYGQNLLGPKVLLADSLQLLSSDENPRGCSRDLVRPDNTWICDPVAAGVTSDDVFPRPVGGENALVANVELRFPLASRRWTGVAFVDFGRVWSQTGEVTASEGLSWSPGLGIRYRSPVGPLRLDVAYNTGGVERLPVVTALNEAGQTVLVQLVDENGEPVRFEYNPYEEAGLARFFSRLQLHFSIGHAF